MGAITYGHLCLSGDCEESYQANSQGDKSACMLFRPVGLCDHLQPFLLFLQTHHIW